MRGVKWTHEQVIGTKAGETLFGDQIIPSESKQAKTKKSRQATNDLTSWAIDYLNDSKQFQVHRSNNIPSTRIARSKVVINAFDKYGKPIEIKYDEVKVFFKKNNIKERILDISGFILPYNGNDNLAGKHFEIEVKRGDDSLSEGQKTRIADIKRAGGVSFVFDSKETFMFQIAKCMVDKKLAF